MSLLSATIALAPPRPTHPDCPICDLPMWLVKVQIGDIADHQQFECKVCDGKIGRTVPHELHI